MKENEESVKKKSEILLKIKNVKECLKNLNSINNS